MIKKQKDKINVNVAIFLALKNLFFKKGMLVLILVIISLGFLSMTFAGGIIIGLKNTIIEQNVLFATGNIMLEPSGDDIFIKNTKEIEKKVLAQKEVYAISSHLTKEVTLLDDNDNIVAGKITIVDADNEARVAPLKENILIGEYLKNDDNEIGVFLERGYLEEYKKEGATSDSTLTAKLGENIELVTTDAKTKRVKIIGVFASSAFGGGKIYMTKKSAKEVFDLDEKDFDSSSSIVVRTRSFGEEDKVITNLKKLNVNADIKSYEEKLGTVEDFINSLLLISDFTAFIGIVVSFATIFIMVYVNVIQKRSQIGIMKAIGINGKTILSSYMIQSIFYGVFGGFFGFIIAQMLIFFFSLNPIYMPFGAVVPFISAETFLFTFLALFVSSLIAGYFASRGVIKENILDAIFKG